MILPRLTRTLLAALACLALCFPALAQNQDQPSLGELARRNKEKKAQQDATKSKKVYGSEDLPKAPPGSESAAQATAAAPAGSSAGAATEAPAGSEAAATKPEGEAAAPSPEAEEAKAALERAKADEAAVQKNIEKLEKQLETETSEFRRNLYQESLQRSKENLAAYRAKREEAEKAAAAAGSGKKPEGEAPPQ